MSLNTVGPTIGLRKTLVSLFFFSSRSSLSLHYPHFLFTWSVYHTKMQRLIFNGFMQVADERKQSVY